MSRLMLKWGRWGIIFKQWLTRLANMSIIMAVSQRIYKQQKIRNWDEVIKDTWDCHYVVQATLNSHFANVMTEDKLAWNEGRNRQWSYWVKRIKWVISKMLEFSDIIWIAEVSHNIWEQDKVYLVLEKWGKISSKICYEIIFYDYDFHGSEI